MKLTSEEEKLVLEYRRNNQFNLKGGNWYFNAYGVNNESSTEDSREFGTERTTKIDAELAYKRSREMQRLSALANQLEVEKSFVRGDKNFFIWAVDGKWEAAHDCFEEIIGAVYMTEEGAKTICSMLNEGRFVL